MSEKREKESRSTTLATSGLRSWGSPDQILDPHLFPTLPFCVSFSYQSVFDFSVRLSYTVSNSDCFETVVKYQFCGIPYSYSRPISRSITVSVALNVNIR